MCDLKRVKLYWYELLPYVDVDQCGRGVINNTGVLYDFFRESLAECCGTSRALDFKYKNQKMSHQQEVLNNLHRSVGSVGMPISLDAEFPHTPQEFVPVVETDGLFWVKVREPVDNSAALGGISTTALPILLVVITLTGYAAVILWLLELRTKDNVQFSKSFMRGVFETFWCSFITATTIGYGDKVAQSYAGKVFTIIWILFGICLISLFTAVITTVMSSIMAPSGSGSKPFYDEFIGVLEGSLDYLVLVKKSANSVVYPDTSSLAEALNNGSTFNIVMDKHAYWVYRAKIHQNQLFEFRPGVQNPTSIGYVYSTNNVTLLRCLKDYAMQSQVQVTLRLEELVKEAVTSQPPDMEEEESLFFGPHTYTFLLGAIGVLIGICMIGGLIDFIVQRVTAHRRKSKTDASPAVEEEKVKNGFEDTESATDGNVSDN